LISRKTHDPSVQKKTHPASQIDSQALRIPPVRLFDRGQLSQDLLDIVFHNVRVSDERYEDIVAQVTGLNVGAEQLTKLLDRYGKETVFAVIEEMQRRGVTADARSHRRYSSRNLRV
jgi:N-methylhydantoinase B/oxoprolinase/acetone carboxylase alpha subunit